LYEILYIVYPLKHLNGFVVYKVWSCF